MTNRIVRAAPHSLAIALALPVAAAALGLALPPLAAWRQQIIAAAAGSGIALVLGWCWVIGHAVNRRIAAERRPASTLFRLSVVFITAWIAAFLLATFASSFLVIERHPAALVALQLLAMAALVYAVRFIGTNLALAEREASIAPAATSLTALALFSVAGLLPIQRRVNRLFADPKAAAARRDARWR